MELKFIKLMKLPDDVNSTYLIVALGVLVASRDESVVIMYKLTIYLSFVLIIQIICDDQCHVSTLSSIKTWTLDLQDSRG